MAITDIAGGGAGGFPWLQAASTAIGVIGANKQAKADVRAINQQALAQTQAAAQAVSDFQIQALASAQQQQLALERADLAQRAEAETLRQARLVENVDVSVGPTLEAQREARLRRRRFFNQEP